MRTIPFCSKVSLVVAVFVGFFAFTTAAPIVRADDCQERLTKIDHKLHEAIEHHGSNSSEANHWRHELHEQREHCYSVNHRWWDEDDHRWHTDRDWDDRDHDRDHDNH